MDKRIEDAAEEAELAMWAVVVEAFPEATSGDTPFCSDELTHHIKVAIAQWCGWNVPEDD